MLINKLFCYGIKWLTVQLELMNKNFNGDNKEKKKIQGEKFRVCQGSNLESSAP